MGIITTNIEKLVKNSTRDIRDIPVNPAKTVVVNMNTINGYFRFGKMASSQLSKVTDEIFGVNEYFMSARKLFSSDAHSAQSPELKTFPEHCLNEEEREIISELSSFKAQGDVVYKNSANLFMSFDFIHWLSVNDRTADNYVITGGMTDIDVMQFALAQKAYFNEHNRQGKIIVVENATRSFSSSAHDGIQAHYSALYNMLINGVLIARI